MEASSLKTARLSSALDELDEQRATAIEDSDRIEKERKSTSLSRGLNWVESMFKPSTWSKSAWGPVLIVGVVTAIALAWLRPPFVLAKPDNPLEAPRTRYGLIAVVSATTALSTWLVPTLLAVYREMKADAPKNGDAAHKHAEDWDDNAGDMAGSALGGAFLGL